MSKSLPEGSIDLPEDPKTACAKIKRALTGGRDTLEEHRRLGAVVEKDMVFELLKQPQYSDVLEKFKKSCVLASLHLAGLRVMAANARFRDYLSPNLIRLVLWDEFKNSVSGYAPEAVKKIYRGLCGRPGA